MMSRFWARLSPLGISLLLLASSCVCKPLIDADKDALLSWFRGVQPTSRYPGPGWNEAGIATLCETGDFPAFECVDYNQTHSAILGIHLSEDFVFKFLPGIGKFQRLETIDITGIVLQGTISPELGQITTLKMLRLIDPELTDRNVADYFHGPIPSELGNLINLDTLNIRGFYCNGTIPASFASLTNLVTLTLEGNLLTSPLPDLSALTKLRYLNLASNLFYQDLPSWISNLPSLENIVLSYNNFTGNLPASFASAATLWSLQFDDNLFSGNLPDSWALLPNLATLDAQYNQLTGALPTNWQTSSLRHLKLAANHLVGPLPDGLSRVNSTLVTLDVSDNSLSGTLPPWLASFSILEELSVGGNRWGPGPVPAWLSQLPALQTLRLHSSQFSGDVPQSVGQLNVTVLDLSDNFLNCPTYQVPVLTSCLWHSNYLCTQAPLQLYQPSCTTIPDGCRTTPCRDDRKPTPLTAPCTAAGGEVSIPLQQQGVELLYDPCYPRVRIQFRLATGLVYTDLAILRLSDDQNKFSLVTWPTETLKWDISSLTIQSRNNPNVPQITYNTTLPNMAQFSMTFWYYELADEIKVYRAKLPITSHLVKFGAELNRWAAITALKEKYIGVVSEFRNSEPAEVLPGFQEFLTSAIAGNDILSAFGFLYPTANVTLNIRVPLLGQADNSIGIPGFFAASDAYKAELFSKASMGVPLESVLIPLRLKIGHRMSYDPDFSLLLDSSRLLDQSASNESNSVAIAAGVSVSGVLVIAVVVAVVWWNVRRRKHENERIEMQRRLNEPTPSGSTPLVAKRPESQTWVSATQPPAIANVPSS